MNVRTNLVLPADIVRSIDEIAGPRGRSRYVADALRRQLRRDRQENAFEATFGSLSVTDYPEWSTPERVIDWVRARRSETTDADVDVGAKEDDVPGPGLDVRDRPSAGRRRRTKTVASDVRGG